MSFTARMHRNGELIWAMGAETMAHIDADLKRDAWVFNKGDALTVRESRTIVRRETIPKEYHGWDTTRNAGRTTETILKGLDRCTTPLECFGGKHKPGCPDR